MSDKQRNLMWKLSAVAVLMIAAAVRFYGLTWGLPNSIHSYSYHPDEFLLVGSAFNIFSNGDINPHFYNYPSLYIYLCALGQGLAVLAGFANDFGLYIVCRIISALMGVAAVAVCMFGCAGLYGRKAGAAAGLFLALLAVHAQHAHFGTVDVPSTLFVSACLIAAIKTYRTGSIKWLIISAIMAGFAAGTKYNAGLVGLAAITAPLVSLQNLKNSQRVLWMGLVAVIAFVAFAATTPGVFLFTEEFIHGLTYELKHSAEGHGLVFAGTGPGLIYALKNLMWGMSLPLLITGLAAVVYSFVRKQKESLILLVFLLPYLILMSTSQVRFVRYAIPMLPVFALFVAIAYKHIEQILSSRKQVVLNAVLSIVYTATALYCVGIVGLFAPPDPRDSAYEYISSNLENSQQIGLIDLPWFYSPPLGKLIGYGTLQTRREALSDSRFPIVLLSENPTVTPEWIIMSSYEVDDALRLRQVNGLSPSQTSERDRILSVYDEVQTNYQLARSFERNVLWFSSTKLPHDMNYSAPRIDIYRLKK